MTDQTETPETRALLARAHPWHGIESAAGDQEVRVFIETLAFDTLKYELDHETGILRVDRPLHMSSLPPTPYGFIPRTLCGPGVAALGSASAADGSPLDIFVVSERVIDERAIIATVRIVGGVPVSDNTLADDKLIGVLARDGVHGDVRDIGDLPVVTLDRIAHFLAGDTLDDAVTVGDPYDRKRAMRVLAAARRDYTDAYG